MELNTDQKVELHDRLLDVLDEIFGHDDFFVQVTRDGPNGLLIKVEDMSDE